MEQRAPTLRQRVAERASASSLEATASNPVVRDPIGLFPRCANRSGTEPLDFWSFHLPHFAKIAKSVGTKEAKALSSTGSCLVGHFCESRSQRRSLAGRPSLCILTTQVGKQGKIRCEAQDASCCLFLVCDAVDRWQFHFHQELQSGTLSLQSTLILRPSTAKHDIIAEPRDFLAFIDLSFFFSLFFPLFFFLVPCSFAVFFSHARTHTCTDLHPRAGRKPPGTQRRPEAESVELGCLRLLVVVFLTRREKEKH